MPLTKLYKPPSMPAMLIAIVSHSPQRVIFHGPMIAIAMIVEPSRFDVADSWRVAEQE